MTVEKLIQLAERRIANLEASKVNAESVGDVDAIARFDAEIAETQATLTQLRSLP